MGQGDGRAAGGPPRDGQDWLAAATARFRAPVAPPLAAWLFATLAGIGLFALIFRRSARAAFSPAPDGPAIGWAESRGLAGPVPAPETPADEASIPRWRRPSVQAARRGINLGARIDRPPLRFDRPPAAGTERRTIHYRLVRVSDAPDDLRSSELGRLDRGDEVDVLEWSDGWVRVRAGDGLEGWVPAPTVLAAG